MFGTNNATEQPVSFLLELGLKEENLSIALRLLRDTDSRYLRDLKINVNNALNAGTLNKKEAYLLAYAVALNDGKAELQIAFSDAALKEGATEKEISEMAACTSLLNANNVYYRFRHFMNDETYNNTPAGIRMSIMSNPALGKEFFELASLVVSALNGCELCVTSHEKTLISQGTTRQRIHDAVRLGAVIRSLSVLLG